MKTIVTAVGALLIVGMLAWGHRYEVTAGPKGFMRLDRLTGRTWVLTTPARRYGPDIDTKAAAILRDVEERMFPPFWLEVEER